MYAIRSYYVSMQRLDRDGLYVAPVLDGDTLYVQTRSGELVAVITSYSIHYTKLYERCKAFPAAPSGKPTRIGCG